MKRVFGILAPLPSHIKRWVPQNKLLYKSVLHTQTENNSGYNFNLMICRAGVRFFSGGRAKVDFAALAETTNAVNIQYLPKNITI